MYRNLQKDTTLTVTLQHIEPYISIFCGNTQSTYNTRVRINTRIHTTQEYIQHKSTYKHTNTYNTRVRINTLHTSQPRPPDSAFPSQSPSHTCPPHHSHTLSPLHLRIPYPPTPTLIFSHTTPPPPAPPPSTSNYFHAHHLFYPIHVYLHTTIYQIPE